MKHFIFAFLNGLVIGWLFSAAYIIGPKYHYKKGYEDGYKQYQIDHKQTIKMRGDVDLRK